MNWFDTVNELKMHIMNHTELAPVQQQLLNGSDVLSDLNATLQHYNVVPSQPLTLFEVALEEGDELIEIMDFTSGREDRDAGFGDTRLGGPRKKIDLSNEKEKEMEKQDGKEAAPEVEWTCGACTFHNKPLFLACDACGSKRPSGPETVRSPPRSPMKRSRDDLDTHPPPKEAQKPVEVLSSSVHDPMDVEEIEKNPVSSARAAQIAEEEAASAAAIAALKEEDALVERPSKRSRIAAKNQPHTSPRLRLEISDEDDESYDVTKPSPTGRPRRATSGRKRF